MPIRVLIIAVLAMAVVAGCGRRGALEAPPSAAAVAPAQPLPDGGVSPLDPGSDALGASAAPPPPPASKRRFFLDFLL